jgi:hypothetical protein
MNALDDDIVSQQSCDHIIVEKYLTCKSCIMKISNTSNDVYSILLLILLALYIIHSIYSGRYDSCSVT